MPFERIYVSKVSILSTYIKLGCNFTCKYPRSVLNETLGITVILGCNFIFNTVFVILSPTSKVRIEAN